MNKDIKIVACDIDGTLEEFNGGLTDRTKKTIELLMENGIRFGIASGRPVFQIRNTLDRWKLKYEPDFLLGFNGAQLYDKQDQSLTNYFSLSTKDLKDIIDFIAPVNDLGNISMYVNDKMLYQKDDKLTENSRKKYKNVDLIRLVGSTEDFYKQENAKLMFRLYDVKDMERIEKMLKDDPRDNFVGYKTQANLMEFTHPLTNKGYTLLKYGEKYGISKENIAAFGDTTNDNAMLEAVGMSVCLKNGSDDTKAIAKYVTEDVCSNDGWAKFVEEYILR